MLEAPRRRLAVAAMLRVPSRAVLVLVVSVLTAGVAYGAQTPRQQAFTLAGQLMSPFCPGLLLSSCQSQGAHDLKDEITRRLEAGESQDAVVADLVRRFGPGIRGAPEMRGLGLVAWTIPAVVGAITAVVLGFALRRLTRVKRKPHESVPPVESAELRSRLDEELAAVDAL